MKRPEYRRYLSTSECYQLAWEDSAMPEISRFLGLILSMYYSDHRPPHFHVRYGDHEAIIEIATGRMLAGDLPPRSRALVEEWRLLHVAELCEDWQLAETRRPLKRIAPLE